MLSFRNENENSAMNFNSISFGGFRFYFSYNTCIGVYIPKVGLKVMQNYWGTTTGKHLNWLDGGSKEAKEKRLSEKEFNSLLEKININITMK